MLESWTSELATRHLFFTGKGGVGKTTLACSAAAVSAFQGRRTLIVSTDPASNLDEAFGVKLGMEPTPIPAVPNLWGMNLDPMAAAAAYREKVVGPWRGKLPEAVVRNMEEQFSGACTTEIAAFDEFVRLLNAPQIEADFDRIIFDTAPTGHTLRLLSLPGAWSDYLETTTAESSCLGPLAGLQDKREAYAAAVRRLGDPEQTRVCLVARAEPASLREADRTAGELAELGVSNLFLLVNAVFTIHSPEEIEEMVRDGEDVSGLDDPLAAAIAAKTREALSRMPARLGDLPGDLVPFDPMTSGFSSESVALPESLPWAELVAQIGSAGRGAVMTMGKGGVGKTTVAVRLARDLAAAGHRVHLTTTDPAGGFDADAAGPNLTVSRIDPAVEIARYTESALARASESLDPEALALLAEDLRSPCTEEIAVFRAFAEAVERGEDEIVVIDTAPTGHTILLMDAAEAYHREVARTQSDAPESVRRLLPRLRDSEFTRTILVALPESTPVHEAASLDADLRRAGITPFAWVVNRSLAVTSTAHPFLQAKAETEPDLIAEAAETATRLTILPWEA